MSILLIALLACGPLSTGGEGGKPGADDRDVGTGDDTGGGGGGDDTGGGGGGDDTGGGGGDGGSLRWQSFEATCENPRLVEFTGVPAGAMAIFFTYDYDYDPGTWLLNPALGMGDTALLDDSEGTLSIPCGESDMIRVGSHARVALGYPAATLPTGDSLGVDVYDVVCGERPEVLADNADMDFASLAFATESDGYLSLNPGYGMDSVVRDGEVQVDCGIEGNTVRSGSGAYASVVSASGADLRWETFEGECTSAAGLFFDATPGAVVTSFQVSSDGHGEVWSINTGYGVYTTLDPDGRIEVPCGEENAIRIGYSVRIALGYTR